MSTTETAIFGGGCFWCLEAIYQQVTGVLTVTSGYAGGHTNNPSYQEVCTGKTHHAEVIQIKFDARISSYQDLLEIFFASHDPTTLNRQGNDIGSQYRSIIIATSSAQKQQALDMIARLNKLPLFAAPIVTEVITATDTTYWPGEIVHQNFYRQNRAHAYCNIVISPKLANFKIRARALHQALTDAGFYSSQ